MSVQKIARALARMGGGAVLAQASNGRGFAVYPNGDRRRRPLARLGASEVRELAASGALQPIEAGGFALSEAGRARVRREQAQPGEAFAAQHAVLVDRPVAGADGALRTVRGAERHGVLRRLAALRGPAGEPWLSPVEMGAAATLRADWERGEIGLMRGSDWSDAPIGGSARDGGAQEAALAARCDAHRRLAEKLEALAPPLRRVVERALLKEEGIEALERAEGLPARSGKLALKLGLAQLAQLRR
ncbi:MAG: DUF6456 domain-containing protein [Hyphomonadaceae bacterium]